MNPSFEKIAPYLQDPLILVGFFLFLAFLFARAIIHAGIIPQLTRAGGYRVLQRILLYGFIIALALIVLGFALKHGQLSRDEQIRTVGLLKQELADNLAVLHELNANTETILGATQSVSAVLRTPGIRLLAAMFPRENLNPLADVPASADYAEALLSRANRDGLIENKLEVRKFTLAAQAISGTIERTIPVIQSLADTAGQRYIIKSDVWQGELPVLRKVSIVDVSDFEATYADFALARADYNEVVGRCLDYLTALDRLLNPPDHKITRQRLAAALGTERLYVDVVSKYGAMLINDMDKARKLEMLIDNRSATF